CASRHHCEQPPLWSSERIRSVSVLASLFMARPRERVRTMATHRPPPFSDSDTLTYRPTPASDYRIPYTLVQSLNEGTLFDRPVRTFEEAARTQRLYDVLVGEDQRIIGAGMLQDTLKQADGRCREEELGALMVHPAARGIGIVGLMIKLILVQRYAVL